MVILIKYTKIFKLAYIVLNVFSYLKILIGGKKDITTMYDLD